MPYPGYDGNYVNLDSDTRTLVKQTSNRKEVWKLTSFNSGWNELYKYVITYNDNADSTTVNETLFYNTSVQTVYSGNTTTITSGENTVKYSYDEENEKETITYNDTEVYSAYFSYDEENNKTIKSYPSYNYTTYQKYDDKGNIVSDNRADNEVYDAYTYNDNGELIKIYSKYRGQYTYDSRGNMLTQRVKYKDNVNRDDTYVYNTSGWKDQLIAVNGTPLTYDGAGNLISYGSKQYTWTYGKTLESVKDGENTYSYTYDENGIRTKKIINGETTYINSRDGVVYAQKNSTDSMYFQYNGNGDPIGFILNDEQYFYLTDMNGDITGIIDSKGNGIAEYIYTAWGELLEIAPAEAGNTEQYAIAEKNPLRYRGYYYDNETGMYYLQSRYYDPQFCRFISADQFDYVNTDDYAGTNAYTYCLNNPITFVDPTGTSATGILVGLTVAQQTLLIVSGIFFIWLILYCLFNATAPSIPAIPAIPATPSISDNTQQIAINEADKADTKIKTIIKNNKKNSYWKAEIIELYGIKFVTMGEPISWRQAIIRVNNGKSVFAATKKHAKNLAETCSSKKLKAPEIHNKNQNGEKKLGKYYFHYHPNPKTGAHIFYLF